MAECKDIGLRRVPWQSVITAEFSINNLRELEYKMMQERWGNCGIMIPHLEHKDAHDSKEKVIKFLNDNIGKEEQLVSIKDIANQLGLTEEFVISTLKEFGMDVTEG
jgi:hypothetical protein